MDLMDFPKIHGRSGNSHEHLIQDFVSLQELLINTHGISAFQAYEYAHAVYKVIKSIDSLMKSIFIYLIIPNLNLNVFSL